MRIQMGFRRAARGLAVVAAVAVAACDSPDERLQSHYERGLELMEEGRVEQAMLEFRNVFRIEGDHAPARFEMGKAQEEKGNLRGAVRQYRIAAESDPEHVEVRVRLARILTAGGALEPAQEVVDEAVALAPEDPEVRAAKAALALRLDDVETALAEARAALETDPELLAAHLVLVSKRARSGDNAAALARVDDMLENGLAGEVPEDERRGLQLLRLNLLSGMGDPEAVKAQLARMADLYPEESRFREALAQLLAQEGDLEGAERELRALAASAPEDAAPTIDLVRFILQARGVEAAEAELEAQIEAAGDPGRAADLRIALAELYAQTERRDAAQTVLEDMIAREEGEGAARARLALARFALAEDDAAAAGDLIEAVLEADAENVEALALRARMAIDDYRPQDAIADLRRAREGDPENPRLMLLEAQAHERSGSLSLAGERLAAATRASEYDPEISQTYVNFLLSQEDVSAAESVLTETARRNPANAAVFARLAEIRLRLEDWVGADQAAEALRRIEGGEAAAAQIVAASLSGQGRFDESSEILRQLTDALGDADRTMASIVANHLRAGNRDRAVAFLEELLADNPDNQRALLLRAELHVQDGETDAALDLLDRLVAAYPEAPVGYLARARLMLALDRREEALAIAEQGAARVENAEPLRLISAQIYEQQKRFDEAIAVYEGLYDRNPGSILYANNLVSLLAEHREDDAEALAFAARVAQRLRGYDIPHLQDTYGWVMFLNGDHATALRSLESAAEGLPQNPLVRYHLGRAYAALEQPTEAREHLEASLAIDPDFPKAESARAALAALPAPE